MVITKFVYRHSWKSNFINIKGIARDSITIMKLTKEQQEDIKNQQSQSNSTRVTSPELEKILYEALPALDHGFVRVVDYMGDDTSIVQSARVSYGKGTKQVSTDAGLIKYLMRHCIALHSRCVKLNIILNCQFLLLVNGLDIGLQM